MNRIQYQEIVTTAIDGGIGYWANIEWYKPSACIALISEPNSKKVYLIDYTTVRTGIKDIVKHDAEDYQLSHDLWQMFVDAYKSGDTGDIDSTMADIIIQVGLFDEIIYA